jgi:hypothetical protein
MPRRRYRAGLDCRPRRHASARRAIALDGGHDVAVATVMEGARRRAGRPAERVGGPARSTASLHAALRLREGEASQALPAGQRTNCAGGIDARLGKESRLSSALADASPTLRTLDRARHTISRARHLADFNQSAAATSGSEISTPFDFKISRTNGNSHPHCQIRIATDFWGSS